MAETIKVSSPDQLPPMKRAADRVVTLGNYVDGAAIIGGIIFTSGTAIALGVLGLAGSAYVRHEHIRRVPKEKVVFDAKSTQKDYALAA